MPIMQNSSLPAAGVHAQILFRNGWLAAAHELCQAPELLYLTEARVSLAPIYALSPQALEENRAMIGGHYPTLVRGDQLMSTLHFATDLSRAQKKLAFKSAVRLVDLETSSQCNRRCDYCPNTTYDQTRDRFTANKFMADEVFTKIIEDFSEIDYHGRIAFHGTNEPLMFVDQLVEQLAYARRKLPSATLTIYTNGDFLTRETLNRLEAVGVNQIVVSVHLQRGTPFNEGKALTRISGKAAELGLHAILANFTEGRAMGFRLIGSCIDIGVNHTNYMQVGHNRGDILDGVGAEVTLRTSPCIQPFEWIVIYYTGAALPCCTLVGDAPQHQPYIVGQTAEQSLFDIYCGEAYVGWRNSTLAHGAKTGPCAACPSDNQKAFPPDWDSIVTRSRTGAEQVSRSFALQAAE